MGRRGMGRKGMKRIEKDYIIRELLESYGVSHQRYCFYSSNGSIDKKIYFSDIEHNLSMINKDFFLSRKSVHRIGIYLGKIVGKDLRMSIDAVQILKPSKRIIDLGVEEMREWLRGINILIRRKEGDKEKEGEKEGVERSNLKNGFYVVRFKKIFLGMGKYSNGVLHNYLPKSRRVKEKSLRHFLLH